jgi:hypothetical protein
MLKLLFRIYGSLIMRCILLQIDEGGSDLGTADAPVVEAETQVESTETVQSEEVAVEQQEQPPVDVEGIQRELHAEREKARRLQEYNEFLRNRPDPNAETVDPFKDVKQMAKDGVPFVEDVEKLIDYKMHLRQEKESEERMLSEVASLADQRRKEDTSYNDKMNLAFELINNDLSGSLSSIVATERTAEGKIRKLEWIATSHPLYGNIATKLNNQEVVDRMKANAAKPTTLASVQGLGSTSKPISQMNAQEYKEYFDSVKKKL